MYLVIDRIAPVIGQYLIVIYLAVALAFGGGMAVACLGVHSKVATLFPKASVHLHRGSGADVRGGAVASPETMVDTDSRGKGGIVAEWVGG